MKDYLNILLTYINKFEFLRQLDGKKNSTVLFLNNETKKTDFAAVIIIITLLSMGGILVLLIIINELQELMTKRKFKKNLIKQYENNELDNEEYVKEIIKKYGTKIILDLLLETALGYSNQFKEDSIIDICTLCFNNINKSGKIARPQCGHSFHYKCIYKYLEDLKIQKNENIIINKLKCPICRESFLKVKLKNLIISNEPKVKVKVLQNKGDPIDDLVFKPKFKLINLISENPNKDFSSARQDLFNLGNTIFKPSSKQLLENENQENKSDSNKGNEEPLP